MAQTEPSRVVKPAYRFLLADLLAGLSVALVAIPQALAYAELAGMPAYTGLYALAFAAIAASFFASSPYLQTGPVAMTSLLSFGVLSTIALSGSPEYMALAGLLALMIGAIRVLLGIFKLGRVAYLMSQPVLMGFSSAAALLILASQIPTALGVTAPGSSLLAKAWYSLLHPNLWNLSSLGLFCISVAILFGAKRLHPLFPGVLVAVIVGISYGYLTGHTAESIGVIPTGLPSLNLALPFSQIPQLLLGATVIAFVGFAEASSIARTYATQDRSRWSADKEFISQGAANLAAGLFAGFPVGGSFSRSSVSRLAGAKTRWSGLATGLLVLAFLPFTFLLAGLPKTVLAAIVMVAVLKLIQLKELLKLRHYSKVQAAIAWISFGLSLVLSPRIDIALLIGISLAIGHHLRREQQVLLDIWEYADILHIKPTGVLWFGSSAYVEEQVNEALTRHSSVKKLEFHLGGLGRIDLSAALMLKRLMQDAKKAGLEVSLSSVPAVAKSWMERVWSEP